MSIESDPLGRLRQIIAAFPETSEKLSHGAPTFWGGRKTFANFVDNHHGDGRTAIWCKATLDAQEHLIAMNEEIFYRPPYVGHKGWVGIRVDREVDWDLIADLLEDGYRSVAPKRAIQQLDEQS